jgi:polysaccharide pyruvyl transferase WcaK-like protein
MRIGLLDHMGYGNLGDAATQEALIANIRSRVPDAEIVGFSLNPHDTQERHNIVSYSITHWHPGLRVDESIAAPQESKPRFQLKSTLKKIPVISPLIRRMLNLGREIAHLARTFTLVRNLDTLIIAGGGQLGDLWRGPWSHPYNVFKFCLLTTLARRRLIFLNVGAGPLKHPLSKVLAKYSIQMANYVSFRDMQSQALIEQIGVKRKTHVYPDSAYALDISKHESVGDLRARPVVGINPIGFCDPRIWPRQDLAVYVQYLDKLAEFVQWLLREDYDVRIYSAEASVDAYAIEDLKDRFLTSFSPAQIEKICMQPSETVEDLLNEMASFDLVVTSKFHGVIFAHLLGKPVVALSYHHKIDDLMHAVGHPQHCLGIESFDLQKLTEAIVDLRANTPALKKTFRESVASRSAALKMQFDQLFVPDMLQPDASEWQAVKSGTAVRDSA